MNVTDIKQHADKVTMELGGETRTLQFDMNAFAELEKRFGSIEKAMENLSSGKVGDIRYVLWAALIHDQVAEFDEFTGEPIKYNITPYQVGSMITSPKMLGEVSMKIGEAMGSDMPDPEHLPEEVKVQLMQKGVDMEGLHLDTKNVPKA